MPAEVAERSRRFYRYTCFVGDAITVTLVLLLSISAHVAKAQMGMNLISWQQDLLFGSGMGVLWTGLQWAVRRLAFSNSKMSSRFFQGGSALLWALVFISGAFSEELWRSFCIVVLKNAGYTPTFIVLATAAVFAIAHIWDGPFKALGRFPFGVAAALAFLWTGSLLTTYTFHLVSNLAGIGWIRRDAKGAE